MTKPTLRKDPCLLAGCYTLDLYCKYTAGYPHDFDTHGKSFHGANEAECKRFAKRAGWVIHRDRTATCRECTAFFAEKKRK